MNLVGLTAAEWGLLVVAIGPAVLAVVVLVVWVVVPMQARRRPDRVQDRP